MLTIELLERCTKGGFLNLEKTNFSRNDALTLMDYLAIHPEITALDLKNSHIDSDGA